MGVRTIISILFLNGIISILYMCVGISQSDSFRIGYILVHVLILCYLFTCLHSLSFHLYFYFIYLLPITPSVPKNY